MKKYREMIVLWDGMHCRPVGVEMERRKSYISGGGNIGPLTVIEKKAYDEAIGALKRIAKMNSPEFGEDGLLNGQREAQKFLETK